LVVREWGEAMPVDLLKPDRKADALRWGLKVLLAPVWVLALVIDDIRLRFKTRPLVRGRVEDAWKRCSVVWREGGLVCQRAAHHRAAFGHELAVALARQHRSQQAFFLSKLSDPDPLLAAYAFKCLIRVGKPRREELPRGVLDRAEPIKVLWADLVDQQSLGSYFEGWFREQEWLRQQSGA
jgi:hypothetical protein